MWHRLALALGSTVEEIQERMTSAEFTSWCAFYNTEPWGGARDDINTAMMLNLTASINRDRKKPGKMTFTDFIIDWWAKPQPAPTNALAAKFMALTKAANTNGSS